ncbi:MAG: LodA/GoxA family CTQ-dependent oxidase [Saprospiraceae bacterium]
MNQLKTENQPQITCSCDNPTDCLRKMFVDAVQKRRAGVGQCPVERPVFRKTHGIAKGTIQFEKDIPEELRHGIFSHVGKTFETYLRYSSDTSPTSFDLKSTIGLGLKIFNMPGEKVVSDDGANVADLILQNSSNFFVDDARNMCSFTKASLNGKYDDWVKINPETGEILEAMKKKEVSILTTKLWSVLPFKIGSNYCKYIIEQSSSTPEKQPNFKDPDYLRKGFTNHLKSKEATLDLYIQPRPLSGSCLDVDFPLDKAMTVWDEEKAKPVKVATITLLKQNIDEPNQVKYGNWLSFNIGRVPIENAPIGSIAETRMMVYEASAHYRKTINEQPLKQPTKIDEPTIEEPNCKDLTQAQKDAIVKVKVHPGIGIGRVGTSEEYYIGPEEINPKLTPFGGTRDEHGAIKRQAARFRVYGYDKYGDLVGEIKHTDYSSIKWSVHVANKKAAWFEFEAAMDIPSMKDKVATLRNPDVKGEDRKKLFIDAGEKEITDTETTGSKYKMIGHFYDKPVYLGELKTDEDGRLVVLPGMGKAESLTNQPAFTRDIPNYFNNARDWYDDIADGPVRASVTIEGREIEAEPGWFASAPPNYAPNVISWRTMNDVIQHIFTEGNLEKCPSDDIEPKSKLLPLPEKVSFEYHVKPILQRLSNLQWVNKGFSAMFGVDGPMNFDDPDLIYKLSTIIKGDGEIDEKKDKDDESVCFKPNGTCVHNDVYQELRRSILNSFRSPRSISLEKYSWPGIYGDNFGGDETAEDTDYYLNLPPIYDYILRKWVCGCLDNDFKPNLSEADILDQAAMHFCIADAFHPGAELTWPMRHVSMYDAPYRIKTRGRNEPAPIYGNTLPSTVAIDKYGSTLNEQGPGDLTKWMAVPWQGDTAYCRSGYEKAFDPYVPTFWPARVPNQVLSLEDYNTLCDTTKTKEERLVALHNRVAWMRTVLTEVKNSGDINEVMKKMVSDFEKMGIVEAKPSPTDMDWLPDTLFVENLQEVNTRGFLANINVKEKLEKAKKLAKTGWIDDEHRQQMYNIRRRK